MPLTIILVECGLELIPKEIRKHSAIQRNLKRDNYSSQLLDNALHHSAMVKLKDVGKRGRPDITHTCLLNALGSPLNKSGNLKLYIHTLNNKIFEFNPQIKITRNYNRFKGLMAKLLRENEIRIKELLLISQFNGNLRDLVKDDNFNPEIVINFIPNDLKGKKDAEELIYDVWKSFQKDYEIKGKDSNNTRIESNKGHQFFGYLIKYINEDFRKAKIGRIHVTTYRKAKGLEADLVITTSIDSSNFAVEDQKRRLLYVAATRSKKHLILTFANKISGARRFTRGRSKKS